MRGKSERQISHHTFDHTYSQYPETWYEKKLLYLWVSLLLTFSLFFAQVGLGLYPNIGLSILGVFAWLTGFFFDSYFTHAALRFKRHFDEQGYEFPIAETGLLLPKYPTLSDHLFSRNALLVLVLTPLVYLLPVAGFVALYSRTCAVLNNLRQQKRLRLTLQLLDQMERRQESYRQSQPALGG